MHLNKLKIHNWRIVKCERLKRDITKKKDETLLLDPSDV